MILAVARRYRFAGKHFIPGLPAPWCDPHEHSYTVEVKAARDCRSDELVVDTDLIDAAWSEVGLPDNMVRYDLAEMYGAASTTVEALAARWLEAIRAKVPAVVAVTVWEDDDRWGRAKA